MAFDALADQGWGIHPILFTLKGVDVQSYPFMVALGLLVGLCVYGWQSSRTKRIHERDYLLVFAAVAGGILGAKVPIWLLNLPEILQNLPNVNALLSGRTVVGGLIGGIVAVNLAKKRLGIHTKTGNPYVPAIAAAMILGRVGCLLRGCCYGIPTTWPWGLDFGGGVFRHPTQVYEILFFLGILVWSLWKDPIKAKPGIMFIQFLVSYFTFRFVTEFLRDEPSYLWGLTLAQVVSLAVIGYYGFESYLNNKQV